MRDCSAHAHPANPAFTALFNFQLHHPDEARAALAQRLALTSDPAEAETWARDAEGRALFKEAEALIDPQAEAKP